MDSMVHLDGDDCFLVGIVEPDAQCLRFFQLVIDAVKEIILLRVESCGGAHELCHPCMRCLAW